MKRKMILITILLLIGFPICLSCFLLTGSAIWEAVTITVGVTLYHFAMRLGVGTVVDRIMKNRANHENRWFRKKRLEAPLYKFLRVRKWKHCIPTYDPDTFDASRKTVRELVGATCQAEVIHEIIMVLSLLPIGMIPFLGGGEALVITSVLSLLIDCVFVILQRYNRPRLIKIMALFEKIR